MIYTNHNRGTIQNREAAKQIIDFRGLRYGNNITPTDVDGLFEINDRIFVFFEFKYKGGRLPYGQRLAFQRIANVLDDSGRHVIIFYCEHEVEAPDDIIAANAIVKQVYYKKRWCPITRRNNTLKDLCDSFVENAMAKDEENAVEYDLFGRPIL